jgi:hypothetical protein
MTFNTLKQGDVFQIDRMFEGGVGFVAGLELAIREASEIERMPDQIELEFGGLYDPIERNGTVAT